MKRQKIKNMVQQQVIFIFITCAETLLRLFLIDICPYEMLTGVPTEPPIKPAFLQFYYLFAVELSDIHTLSFSSFIKDLFSFNCITYQYFAS